MWVGVSLFAISLTLYVARMAPSVVPGDPGEYQLVAARWGIAHPPGYGFYALLGNLFTHAIPYKSFAWRANLLSAVCGAAIVALAYGIGRTLSGRPVVARRTLSGRLHPHSPMSASAMSTSAWGVARCLDHLPAILGALALATGIGLWQHAIHANAHIVTALLATCTLYLILRWWRTGSNSWLYAAAFCAGLGPVQHPLLVFALPAYILFGLFVLAGTGTSVDRMGCIRATLRRTMRTLATAVGFALLGLTAYLYYPIRSAIGAPPAPGPADMHTWAGFFRVVTAQGLRGNLGGFTWHELLQRLWDVRVPLRLQYTWPGLVLAGIGFVHLWWPRRTSGAARERTGDQGSHAGDQGSHAGDQGSHGDLSAWQPALLLTVYLACMLLVTVNVLQDEMAYLLGPMVVVGVLIGLGIERILALSLTLTRTPAARTVIATLLLLAAWMLPIGSLAVNWKRMDLSDYRDADLWLRSVESRFVGQGQRVTLLTEWERMTTVYYYAAVEGRIWDAEDLRFVPISAGTEAPFLVAADENLPRGPVYLATYRPEVAAKYRLMPSGNLWQVLPAWPQTLGDQGARVVPVHIRADDKPAGAPAIEILGWSLDRDRVRPGDRLQLDLYMRLATSVAAVPYYLPWARLGDATYRFTTDSRFNTPWWQPGEIVVERFDLPVPWNLDGRTGSAGTAALEVGLFSVSEGRELDLEGGQRTALLTEVQIEPARWPPSQRKLDRALGNLRGDILLRDARVNGRSVRSPFTADGAPLSLRPGSRLRVVLEWESLRPIDENYKVFVQLLDANLQVRAQGDDKAPLGGSAPTWLWFPRWRRGTRISDTYLLDIPSDLPPGSYPLVAGMYGFSTFKRVQTVSPAGDVGGDWITLAHLVVE